MFDVGFWELVLIFGVGLIILGPERMPRVASQVGRWIGRARRTASTLRRQLEQEIASVDAPRPPPRRKPTPVKPVNRPPDEPKTEADDSSGDDSSGAAAAEPVAAQSDAAPASAEAGEQIQPADDDAEKNASGSAGGS